MCYALVRFNLTLPVDSIKLVAKKTEDGNWTVTTNPEEGYRFPPEEIGLAMSVKNLITKHFTDLNHNTQVLPFDVRLSPT